MRTSLSLQFGKNRLIPRKCREEPRGSPIKSAIFQGDGRPSPYPKNRETVVVQQGKAANADLRIMDNGPIAKLCRLTNGENSSI